MRTPGSTPNTSTLLPSTMGYCVPGWLRQNHWQAPAITRQLLQLALPQSVGCRHARHYMPHAQGRSQGRLWLPLPWLPLRQGTLSPRHCSPADLQGATISACMPSPHLACTAPPATPLWLNKNTTKALGAPKSTNSRREPASSQSRACCLHSLSRLCNIHAHIAQLSQHMCYRPDHPKSRNMLVRCLFGALRASLRAASSFQQINSTQC